MSRKSSDAPTTPHHHDQLNKFLTAFNLTSPQSTPLKSNSSQKKPAGFTSEDPDMDDFQVYSRNKNKKKKRKDNEGGDLEFESPHKKHRPMDVHGHADRETTQQQQPEQKIDTDDLQVVVEPHPDVEQRKHKKKKKLKETETDEAEMLEFPKGTLFRAEPVLKRSKKKKHKERDVTDNTTDSTEAVSSYVQLSGRVGRMDGTQSVPDNDGGIDTQQSLFTDIAFSRVQAAHGLHGTRHEVRHSDTTQISYREDLNQVNEVDSTSPEPDASMDADALMTERDESAVKEKHSVRFVEEMETETDTPHKKHKKKKKKHKEEEPRDEDVPDEADGHPDSELTSDDVHKKEKKSKKHKKKQREKNNRLIVLADADSQPDSEPMSAIVQHPEKKSKKHKSKKKHKKKKHNDGESEDLDVQQKETTTGNKEYETKLENSEDDSDIRLSGRVREAPEDSDLVSSQEYVDAVEDLLENTDTHYDANRTIESGSDADVSLIHRDNAQSYGQQELSKNKEGSSGECSAGDRERIQDTVGEPRDGQMEAYEEHSTQDSDDSESLITPSVSMRENMGSVQSAAHADVDAGSHVVAKSDVDAGSDVDYDPKNDPDAGNDIDAGSDVNTENDVDAGNDVNNGNDVDAGNDVATENDVDTGNDVDSDSDYDPKNDPDDGSDANPDPRVNARSNDGTAATKKKGPQRAKHWTKKEDEQLTKNWNQFIKAHPIFENPLCLLFKKEQGGEINLRKTKRQTDFYQRLGEGLERGKAAVVKRAQRLLHPERTNKLVTENLEIAEDMATLGQSWANISEEFAVTRQRVQDAVRESNRKKQSVNKGHWRVEEDTQLTCAVQVVCDTIDQLENVSWEKVAELVDGRNDKQCCYRWTHALYWMKVHGRHRRPFTIQNQLQLVNAIAASGAKDEAELDWSKLKDKIDSDIPSPFWLKKQWLALKVRYPWSSFLNNKLDKDYLEDLRNAIKHGKLLQKKREGNPQYRRQPEQRKRNKKAQRQPKEKPQESSIEDSQRQPKDKPLRQPKEIPQGQPKDNPQGLPKDNSQGLPKDNSQGLPKDNPQGQPKVKQLRLDGFLQGNPKVRPQGQPKDKPLRRLEEMLLGQPKDTPQETHEDRLKLQEQAKAKPQGHPKDKQHLDKTHKKST